MGGWRWIAIHTAVGFPPVEARERGRERSKREEERERKRESAMQFYCNSF